MHPKEYSVNFFRNRNPIERYIVEVEDGDGYVRVGAAENGAESLDREDRSEFVLIRSSGLMQLRTKRGEARSSFIWEV